jgi:lipid A 3-O-deacylase
MYTPADIDTNKVVQGDYPYSGTLFFNFTRETMPDEKKIFRSELWLGVMGPLALAKQTQDFIHDHVPSTKPLGWETQLPNYPIINYNLYYETNLARLSSRIQLNTTFYTQLGSLMNAAQAGLNLMITSDYFDFFPERMYSLNKKEAGKLRKFFIEFRPSLQFVAYNTLLQGGMFQKKNYYYISSKNLNRVLIELSGTIGFQTNRITILYRQNYQTAQFDSVHDHGYGSLIFMLRI